MLGRLLVPLPRAVLCVALLAGCGGGEDATPPVADAASPTAMDETSPPAAAERAVEDGVRLESISRSGDGFTAELTNLNQLPVEYSARVFLYAGSEFPSAALGGDGTLEPLQSGQVTMRPLEGYEDRVQSCEGSCTYEFYADVTTIEEGVDGPLDRERDCTPEICRLGS